jgi:hypothetical protein
VVPLVHHHHQLSTYITGTVRRNKKFSPQQFKNIFAVEKNVLQIWSPFRMHFLQDKITKKILSFFFPPTPRSKKRKYMEDVVGIHKLNESITSYNKFMDSIDSSDMMLYTYLFERWTVCYWKKVAINIIARMVLNSYILYKEKCRAPGNPGKTIVSIIVSLEEE